MRFMTDKQYALLQKLHSAANGDTGLVEQALRTAAPHKPYPSYKDVEHYIISESTKRTLGKLK